MPRCPHGIAWRWPAGTPSVHCGWILARPTCIILHVGGQASAPHRFTGVVRTDFRRLPRPESKAMQPVGFVQKFDLRDADAQQQCAELKARLEREAPKLIRLAWSDTHGHSRVKLVPLPVALAALEGGYNINVATTTLDASGARTFSSF